MLTKNDFGKTEKKISRLGFGTMRMPTAENGKIDREKAAEMIDLAYRSGVNYFDTAYMYHDGDSEVFLGETLTKYPRESYYLADKMPVVFCEKEADAERFFTEQLQRCRTEYFDFYMLHSLNSGFWGRVKKFGILDKLIKKKADGKIRHIGFSFHGDWESFIDILDAYDWEFAQLQFNYIDDVKLKGRKYYDELAKRGIPCIVMEPVRGGVLADLPEEALIALGEKDNSRSAELAFKWLFQFENAQLILSGMSNLHQVEDNLRIFQDTQPATTDEAAALERVRDVMGKLQAVMCTGCGYCSNCPSGIAIAKNMSIYNEYKIYRNAYLFGEFYDGLNEKSAANCTECGVCKPICPQALDIPAWMKTIAKEREALRA